MARLHPLKQSISLRCSRFAGLVLLGACAGLSLVHAQEAVRTEEGSVSFGTGWVSGSDADRAQFGQYSALQKERTIGADIGADYTLRDPVANQWVDFRAAQLLSSSRDLDLVYKKPGHWVVTVDYGERVRFDTQTLNSGISGVGTTQPSINLLSAGAGSGADFNLNLHRQKLKVGLGKQLTPRMQLQMNLGIEKKRGAQRTGVGAACPSLTALTCDLPALSEAGWATLFLPEPVSSSHSTMDVRLSYVLEKLKFSVGYQGSFYRNDYATITPTVPGSLFNSVGSVLPLTAGLQAYLQRPLALAPDNQAHQIDLAGLYDINPTHRVTFKLARAIASQNASFAQAGLPDGLPAGVTALDGRLTSDLAQVRLVARPMPKLHLIADWRYENRDDQTPLAQYGGVAWTNPNMSLERRRVKLLANWQFSNVYRGSLGLNVEDDDRGPITRTAAVRGVSALRQQTSETIWSAALRRRLTEDVSGALSWSSARRDGSVWLRPFGGAPGVVEVADPSTGFVASSIFMPTLADRTRDKLRLNVDWQGEGQLSTQFHADLGQDRFRAPGKYGLTSQRMSGFGVDMNYAYSFSWNWNGFLSTGSQTLHQGWADGHFLAFENSTTTLGLGFTGKLKSAWQLGGMLSYALEKDVYRQSLDDSASTFDVNTLAASGGLPDVRFSQSQVKLFATYALDKQAAIRFDFVHMATRFDDWTWAFGGVPYTYSDGTTLSQAPRQSANFVGVRYIYKWK